MTSVTRPNFVDSPYFVDEPEKWHLKPDAPKEVVKEFREFMKLTKTPFIGAHDNEAIDNNITLHEAIKRVINKYGPAQFLK